MYMTPTIQYPSLFKIMSPLPPAGPRAPRVRSAASSRHMTTALHGVEEMQRSLQVGKERQKEKKRARKKEIKTETDREKEWEE